MVKAPAAGRAKTRLATAIGAAEAMRFYRSATAALLRTLGNDPRWRTVLAVAPDGAIASPAWPLAIARTPQGRGDLGQRMQGLFDRLKEGPVVIIGSDIPGITSALVASAFRELGRNDAVFGPAEDGGYWLVGLKRFPNVPRAFTGVRWSSRHTLKDTLRNLEGRSIAFLECLADVDTADDWQSWRRRNVAAPAATRRVIRRASPCPVSSARRGAA
jgi:rSAM/selenodomain-associated transferase 1